jgi:hypothetical protein
MQSPPPSTILQQSVLATSLAGNAVNVLTITAAADRGRRMSQRQGVILSGVSLASTAHAMSGV